MLKGISPILSPELLKILMEMGHGDELCIGDGNFPAASIAQRLVRLDGHGVTEILDAILALFPLDTRRSSGSTRATKRSKTSAASSSTTARRSATPSWRPAKARCTRTSS